MEENTTAPQQKSNTATIAIVAVIALLAIAGIVYAMRGNKSSNQATTTSTTNGTSASKESINPATSSNEAVTSGETMTNENEKVINVEAGSFYFKPDTITVKKGQKVKIVLHAVSMMHDFYIDELNVKSPIVKNGDTGTVEFTPDQVGTFEYYCSVGQHRANGQVGKITVEE
jgi:nitrosocyanin